MYVMIIINYFCIEMFSLFAKQEQWRATVAIKRIGRKIGKKQLYNFPEARNAITVRFERITN